MLETPELPTTAIYFTASMADLIGPRGDERRPIWRVTPNVFFIRGASATVLVFRNWDATARRRLKRLPPAGLRYVLDDDIWAGVGDALLPARYRTKLAAMAAGPAAELIGSSEKIYVSSPPIRAQILKHFGARDVAYVRPALVEPVGGLAHHDRENDPVDMIFAGTASHMADLEAIAVDLGRALERFSKLRLHTFLGGKVPGELLRDNAVHHARLTWPGYRAVLNRGRYHLALGPSLPTPFNLARSANKILEYASFGAAPVFSADYPHAEMAERAGAAFFSEMRAGAWLDAIEALMADRGRMKALAAGNRALALEIGDRRDQRRFWLEEFGLSG